LGIASLNANAAMTAHIHAPAVILQNNTGTLTVINLTVTAGTGKVVINGPAIVAQSTLNSSEIAVQVASNYLHVNEHYYNFEYYIDNATNVSGPSAGTAMTLLAISALSNRPLLNNFTVTGTMSYNGTIGEIGGVYDKASAAASNGMGFFMVPRAPPQSQEELLYYLIQNTFSIPLIQVSNISDAAAYAFSYNRSMYSNEANYSLFTNYNVSRMPNAILQCRGDCQTSGFHILVNFTFNMTAGEIGNLTSRFGNVTGQLSAQLSEAENISGKGYLYLGADYAFLDYINAYYFAHYQSSKQAGIDTINSVANYCSSVKPASLNSNNYEFVLGGELRQLWGAYTASSLAQTYNLTAIDSDGVLNNLYTAGEANAWCNSAGLMYGIAGNVSGTAASTPSSLKSVALRSINNARAYGLNMYLQTAQQAYSNSNYPLAILDASYARAIYGLSTNVTSMSVNKLISNARSIASNSTFGVWATQFANEADFYASEASISSNSSTARGFAEQAYQTAALAQMISNDTQLIASSLIPNTTTTTSPINVTTVPQQSVTPPGAITLSGTTVAFIIFSVVILLVAVLIVLLIVLYLLISMSKRLREIHLGTRQDRRNEMNAKRVGAAKQRRNRQ
ncbi:peptidase S16 lon domain protein, partial [mine drainage metagenome]